MSSVEQFFNDKFSMEQKAIEFIKASRDNGMPWSEIIENESYQCHKVLRDSANKDLLDNVYVLAQVAYVLAHELRMIEIGKK